MAFGENREGGGGIQISLAAVANTAAALAIAGICGALWADHSSVIKLTDGANQTIEDLKRVEVDIKDLKTSVGELRDQSQEMKDVRKTRDDQVADLYRRFERDEKLITDLDLLLRPPRSR